MMKGKRNCMAAALLILLLCNVSACASAPSDLAETAGVTELSAVPAEPPLPIPEDTTAPAETEPPQDDADYTQMEFPNYSLENPIRYAAEEMGRPYDGWQDFGLSGEIRTVPQPMGMTYIYQMYSWFIRNDLRLLYPDDQLPESAEAIPEWIADTTADRRRTLFLSMGDLPAAIMLLSSEEMSVGENRIVKAKYVVASESSSDRALNWILYFLAQPQTYSVFAVRINEGADTVERLTDSIVQSYRLHS